LKPGEVVTLDLPDIHFRGPATVVKIQPSTATAEVEATILRVVRFRHDDDLGTPLHGDWSPPPDFVERWKSRRRRIVLKLEYPDGGWCDIRLLRTVKWIAETGAQVGATIFLDLAEVGTRGWAKVLEILPCGPIEIGPGDIVTGTFRHSHGQVGELVLESESKPIGVTPGHLFWSVDRQAWVPVSSLRRGETLQTLKGETQVVSYTMTDRVEPVYNIEVEGAHCYRVGESGVLVHNMSVPGSEVAHRIGGGDAANLTLKPAEEKLDPPGISVLIGGTPEQAAADIRRVFGPRSSLGKLARVVGTAEIKAIRVIGFDVIAVPTNNFPNHGRLIHPCGIAGFTPENLAKLATVFASKGGL
jgi:hypothetical protein